MLNTLDEVLDRINTMEPKAKAELVKVARESTSKLKIIPNPGQQTKAYFSDADIILYGGAGGGGKSFLAIALAVQKHLRSIIFRREATQTDGLIANAKEVIGEDARFNGQDLEFNYPDGKSIKFAGLSAVDDWRKHAGRERDLMVYDEAAEFLEVQVASLQAWNRGPDGVHCQILLASNPPRTAEGAWLKKWFAPWLDPKFHAPAKDGEIRWAIYRNGETKWVDGPEPIEIEGELVYPKSRTFISALLKDNPYRDTVEYRASLQSLPDTLRKQMLHGDFTAGEADDAFQTIPTSWVREAQRRWNAAPPRGTPMCAIGTDVAQGGGDNTVLSIRYDGWYAPLIVYPGVDTPDGKTVAGKVITHRRDNCPVAVDIGGGWGGEAHAHLRENKVDSRAYMGVKASLKRTVDKQLKFTNVRTEAYWRFREALDPSQPQGSIIALPDDPELVADLCAPTYEITPQGIKVEPKEKVVKRLGRSPDRGDAVVMAWWVGPTQANIAGGWSARNTAPRVVVGRVGKRRT
jgi:hypothetical protein